MFQSLNPIKDDLVQGVDPFNNFNYLGDNTGLVHYFVYSTVVNGVNYSYTITAYDSGSVSIGLESLESSKGTTQADANLVDVTPRSNAIGYEHADILKPISRCWKWNRQIKNC